MYLIWRIGWFVGGTVQAGVAIAYPLSQVTLGIGSLIGVGAGSALFIALGANDKLNNELIDSKAQTGMA